MTLCTHCSEQAGKSASEAAHSKLRLIDPGPLTKDGWRETWQCALCETVWIHIATRVPETPHRWMVAGNRQVTA